MSEWWEKTCEVCGKYIETKTPYIAVALVKTWEIEAREGRISTHSEAKTHYCCSKKCALKFLKTQIVVKK